MPVSSATADKNGTRVVRIFVAHGKALRHRRERCPRDIYVLGDGGRQQRKITVYIMRLIPLNLWGNDLRILCSLVTESITIHANAQK